jgi:DNA-directed RNA polymerase specialized sigma24 family protein
MNPRARSTLTGDRFHRLLAHLDPDRERAGTRYETLRAGLVRFFEWRGCAFPGENADEVLDRVARKIDEGEPIEDVGGYATGVARFVYKEVVKEAVGRRAALEQLRQLPAGDGPADDVRLECIRQCLHRMAPEDSRLLLSYYDDHRREKIEWRRQIAAQLGIALPALRMRLYRLRARLEACATDCVARAEKSGS